MTPQYFAASSVYTDQLVPGKGALLQTFSTWHPNTNLNTQIQIKNLTPTLERRCNFSRRDWELFFLLSPGETRSRLSYDHSRISRRERDSILLLSCFETRSRLQKIISRGRARKNEADSRREFPGSRILADLWFITTMVVARLPARDWGRCSSLALSLSLRGWLLLNSRCLGCPQLR